MTERRVGTLTLGISLVGFGVIFLLHTCFGLLDYEMALRFWPLVFILLGLEILLHALRLKGVRFRVDFVAVVTIFLLLVFAGCMGVLELLVEYYNSTVFL